MSEDVAAPKTGPALSLRRLTVRFDGSTSPAAEGIDLDLVAGRVQALVGESGSGKSVTALGSIGLLPSTASVTGSAVLNEDEGAGGAGGKQVELVGAPRRVLDDARGRLVGTIFQEPASALDPLLTIGDQIGEAIRAHRADRRVSRADLRSRVTDLLRRVGLPEVDRMAGAYPHQLSGGQQQRACIALAMACDPPVLVADEPTTALDVTVQAGILDLLRSLTAEGVAVLLITHDMGVVADIADDVAVMRHGRIVERGPVDRIFEHPEHPYTRELLDAVPRLEVLHEPAPAGEQAPGGAAAQTGGPGPVVEVDGLDVVYRARRRKPVHAVRGVSLRIDAGEVLGLVGESGSGKSTIAGTLTGLVPVAGGSVTVDGVEVAGASRRRLLPVRRRTGVVYQNPASALNPRRTVGASIAEPLMLHAEMESSVRRARVRELLDQVRLPISMAERYPHEMSGGQRQRVAIARALALRPRLVIADEPTSALDVSVQAVVLDLLATLQAELGFACLFVSHDLAVVEQVAARTVVLSQGRVVEQGPTASVLTSPVEDYTKRLVAAVPVPDPKVQRVRRAARA